jgi:hypothetical protein
MGLCYQSKTDPDNNKLNLNFSGVDLISWTLQALHIPATTANIMCEEAAPRLRYQALEVDTLEWADLLERALENNDPAIQETLSERGYLFDGEYHEFQAWLGDWVKFFRTCGGYTTD